jgi:hypothetical protein
VHAEVDPRFAEARRHQIAERLYGPLPGGLDDLLLAVLVGAGEEAASSPRQRVEAAKTRRDDRRVRVAVVGRR